MVPASEDSAGFGGGLKRTSSRGTLSLGGDNPLMGSSSFLGLGARPSGQLPGVNPMPSSMAARAGPASSLPLRASADEFPPMKQSAPVSQQNLASRPEKTASATNAAPASDAAPAPTSSPRPSLLKRSRSMGTFDNLVAPEVSDGQKAVEAITGKVSIGQGSVSSAQPLFSESRSAVPVSTPDNLKNSDSSSKSTSKLYSNSNSNSNSQPPQQQRPRPDSPKPSSPAPVQGPGQAHASARSHASAPAPAPAPTTTKEAQASPYIAPREERQNSSPQIAPKEDGQDSPRGLDDSNVQPEPLTRVDYFSHDWTERDIADSWRYIVSRRQDMANSARLENASWRMWAKAKNHLRTVSPEEVNWLKDYDVTWLYGPLYHDPNDNAESESGSQDRASSVSSDSSKLRSQSSERPGSSDLGQASASSQLRGGNVLQQAKKPPKSILKKKTFAQLMLEDAPELAMGEPGSAADYLRHHHYRPTPMGTSRQRITDLLNTQYSQPEHKDPQASVSASPALGMSPAQHPLSNTNSVGSLNSLVSRLSVASSTTPHERKVHFNDRVEQCIAIDPDEKVAANTTTRIESVFGSSTETDDEDGEEYSSGAESDENSGLFLGLRRPSTVDDCDSSIIASLPATTLKYQVDQQAEEEPEEYIPEAATRLDNSHSQRRPGFNANYDFKAVFRAPQNSSVYEIVDPNVKPVDLVASTSSSSSASPEHEKENILSPAEVPLASGEAQTSGKSARTRIRPVASFGV